MKHLGIAGLILFLGLGSAFAADKTTAPAKGEGSMSLLTAIADRNTDAVIRLLNDGADPNTRDADNRTALIHAAATGQFRMMNALLEKKANINAQAKDGTTALMATVLYGDPTNVDILIAAKADVNIRDAKGKTALKYAEERLIPPPGTKVEGYGHDLSNIYQTMVIMLKAAGAK